MSPKESIVLSAGGASARIALQGAEWRSWQVAGREWLWSGDPRWWDEVAPVLFPVVGWTRDGEVRVDGVSRPLGLHGFARHRRFDLTDSGAAFAELRLVDDDATRALYPFGFALTVRYELSPERLAARFTVLNTGDRPMPYAVGFHPGFAWPLPGEEGKAHRILFDAPERPDVPVIAPGGLFSPEVRPVPIAGRALPLGPDSFASQSMCFVDARSGGLVFGPENGRRLRIDFEACPNIVLWSRPGGAYLCVEGWTGTGDPVGFSGDLFEKPGMRVLEPGQAASHGQTMTILDPQDERGA